MTLLEMVIVTALIAGTLSLGISFVSRQSGRPKKTLRMFKNLNRQLDSWSRLKKNTYRVVINMDKESTSWWVEKKNTEDPFINEKENTEEEAGDDAEEENKEFTKDPDFFSGEEQELTAGWRFAGLRNKNKQTTSGQAYIYYFPRGQTEKMILKLEKEDKYWSLLIDRFKGGLEVMAGEQTFKDFLNKK